MLRLWFCRLHMCTWCIMSRSWSTWKAERQVPLLKSSQSNKEFLQCKEGRKSRTVSSYTKLAKKRCNVIFGSFSKVHQPCGEGAWARDSQVNFRWMGLWVKHHRPQWKEQVGTTGEDKLSWINWLIYNAQLHYLARKFWMTLSSS